MIVRNGGNNILTDQSKYYIEIDALKGFAIFLVILGHAIIVFPINLENIYWCYTLKKFIYMFHMLLFFIISGFHTMITQMLFALIGCFFFMASYLFYNI